VTLAGLYNPRLCELACDVKNNCRIVAPNSVFGSQALLISREALGYIVHNWERAHGMQDIRISRLAGRLGSPILYHAPSLVQHLDAPSTWCGPSHQAADFDPDWKAQVSIGASARPAGEKLLARLWCRGFNSDYSRCSS